MRRRILTAMLSVATLAVIGFGVPLAFIIERFIEADATATVERAAVLASREVSLDFATSDDPVEFATRDDGITLSLYDLRGDRFAGDGPLRNDLRKFADYFGLQKRVTLLGHRHERRAGQVVELTLRSSGLGPQPSIS